MYVVPTRTPTPQQLGDLKHRYAKEDRTDELQPLHAKMANLIVFRRHTATIPHGIDLGSEVLHRQALCKVIDIDEEQIRIHGVVLNAAYCRGLEYIVIVRHDCVTQS